MVQYAKVNLSDPVIKKRLIAQIQAWEGEYEFTLASISPLRSDQSNKRYFAILRMFGEYLGYKDYELHDVMKKLFAKLVQMDPKANISTAGMNQRQFDHYVDWVYEYLDRFTGIDPDEIRNP